MSDSEQPTAEFDELWKDGEGPDIRGDDTALAQTHSMRPSAQTRVSTERGEAFVRNLPPIRYTGRADESMPEVELQESIGEGGTAEIRRATQTPLDREVAVKRPRRSSAAGEEVGVLLQEAWITGALQHPNIVPVYRLGREADDAPVLVMKRIEGVSWQTFLDDPTAVPRDFESDRPIDWHLDILMDVCDAVAYAHSHSIIHRDLKPANVMIGEYGETYLVDWGLAVTVADDPPDRFPRADAIEEPAGTPAYMAPEMSTGDGTDLCLQTDIYLLGALLHRIVTGEPPHTEDSVVEALQDAYDSEPVEYGEAVPDRLADICRRAMARDPEDRYQSVAEFRRAIADFREHQRAVELVEQADARYRDFRELLEDEDAEEAQTYEVFGECRFAYDEALEVDPENDRARNGLQTVIEEMVEYELEHGGLKAASLLINEMPEPRPALENRLEKLRQREANREQRYEELKKFERERDVDRGRKTRSLLVLALGAVMFVTSAWPGLVSSLVAFDIGIGDLLLQMVVVGAVVATGLWVGRRQLFQNTANRQLVATLVWICVGVFFFHKTVTKLGLQNEPTIPFQMLTVSVASAVAGSCLDRRIFWAAIPFFLGSYAASELPGYATLIDPVTDLVATGLLALIWWPGDIESLSDIVGRDNVEWVSDLVPRELLRG